MLHCYKVFLCKSCVYTVIMVQPMLVPKCAWQNIAAPSSSWSKLKDQIITATESKCLNNPLSLVWFGQTLTQLITWHVITWSREAFLSVAFKWTNVMLLLLLLSFHSAVYHSSLLVLYKGQHQLSVHWDTLPLRTALPQLVGSEIMTPPQESSLQWAEKEKINKEEKPTVQRPHSSKTAESLPVFLAAPFIETKGKFHGYTKES